MKTLRSRAEAVLAGGTGTFSKMWTRYPHGIGPFALTAGKGCYVTGDDGTTYLDTMAALGPIVLGYGYPEVTRAVMQQVEHGTSFSMVHPLEIEVAELLCTLLPCADMVRFCRNGTDATGMAVRLMRAVTGHRHMIFIGYHGGGMDSYGITTTKHAGILPQLGLYNHQIAWDDFCALGKALYQAQDDLAGIMVEVPACVWAEPGTVTTEILAGYRDYAHTHGGLFTLDEVVTFPRFHLSGAQYVYNVLPDLCCLSKGMANGFPLAALAGQRAVMERLNTGDIFGSYTFAGETTALAACKATLEVFQTTDALGILHRRGQEYGDHLVALFQHCKLPATVWGHAPRLAVRWDDLEGSATKAELRTFWMAEHAKRGVLLGIGVIFPMVCWTKHDVEFLQEVAEDVCTVMRRQIDAHDLRSHITCPVIDDVLSVR